MNYSTSVEHKFRVMDIIYLMYEDRIWKGIITRVNIELESPVLETFQTELILDAALRGKKLHTVVNYPIDVRWIWYCIDLIKGNKFYAGIPRVEEYLVFGSEAELIDSLKLKL